MVTITAESAEKTDSLGKEFANIAAPGDVILLEGQLGGGKTTFVKGLARGLGYEGRVSSPSFTLVKTYDCGGFFVYHLDLYRLEKKDFGSIGLEDYLYAGGGISVVEWGKKIEVYLKEYIKIKFLYASIDKRKLLFSQKGGRKNRLDSLSELPN